MRITWCAALLVLSTLVVSTAADPPRLAVILVVDQMRADYVDRFQNDWSGGLKRMVTRGAWFNRAAYPYLSTVTCAGHATIGTGAFPARHGIIHNGWYDRNTRALVTCTQDGSVTGVPYGAATGGDDSAAALGIPTFPEEMRRQKHARVVSLSLKARSAIMLAGHSGDAVTWLSNSLNGWETSTAFSVAPLPGVQAFIASNPITADYGRTWERMLPPARYPEVDEGLREAPAPGWTPSFPHVLRGDTNERQAQPPHAFFQEWEDSPFADAYLGRMAASLVESMQLGQRDVTDVLAVSFSSPDLVGHTFGPRSQEVHDMYLHLDRTIGLLLDRLDALVGAGQYVVALSADHGVTDIPEQLRARGQDAGRIDMTALEAAVEKAAQGALGPGNYVARAYYNDVYFEPGVFQRLKDTTGALAAVMKAAAMQPGIGRVFDATELAAASTSASTSAATKDPLLRAAALSYFADRSGDLMLAPKPGWMVSGSGTTHGGANPDDQRVPILFFGKGIKPGRYSGPASPADIAPTLADLCGIVLSRAQGKVLRVALAE
jgi:predicted AlkP superfamily pyrophosphatase or phosphodiesterase